MTYVSSKGPISPKHLRDIWREFSPILRRPAALEVLLTLIEYKAATARVLRLNATLSEKSIYNALEFLEAEGFVVKARPLNTKGRPTSVYALYGYTPDDVIKAVERDRIARTPGYAEVMRVGQLILNDFIESPKCVHLNSKQDIDPILRKEVKGFVWRDLKRPVYQYLREKGVEIVYEV